MTDYDAVVIGAGIFGSLLTRALRKAGLSTLTVDARHANAGSPPAACLMRPSWFSSMGKANYGPALEKLDELVGVQELKFKVRPGSTRVYWCDPKKVLLDQNECRTGNVTGLAANGKLWEVSIVSGQKLWKAQAPLVIVAAGIWSNLLFPEIGEIQAQAGVAWLWPDAKIEEPFIRPWAPYKQIVAFNRGDGLWVGDGTSVKNWNDHYKQASLERCRTAVKASLAGAEGHAVVPDALFGYRPYVKGPDPCMFKQVRKGVFVATGGAKNGTLAAGWCVNQLLKAI